MTVCTFSPSLLIFYIILELDLYYTRIIILEYYTRIFEIGH